MGQFDKQVFERLLLGNQFVQPPFLLRRCGDQCIRVRVGGKKHAKTTCIKRIDMIDTCDWALNDRSDNYYDSRRECARVIAEAEAQED